ncbi:MAG: sigma-54-dependent Fis family transcriptional regulator [Proteobacteria bacterium]|nr:sigma-54-dependent Fis family transcriptional regulator [Pseudomonadota bacterium]
MARILLVEDELNLLKMTCMMLSKAGHDVVEQSSGKKAIEMISNEGKSGHGLDIDIVLTDYRLNDVTGLDVLHTVKSIDDSTQVLLVTAYATTQTAVEAMRDGAFDYIEKPFKRDELLALIDKACARRTMMREKIVHVLKNDTKTVLPDFVGDSEQMRNVMDMVSRVAPTRANILITGESGTGKEVVARAIHQISGIQGPFIPVNCGAIPESLVESEFFGYAKGAFTGAVKDKEGFFQAAKGGTLFLDEIAELPIAMQVKLLRAIQEKKIQPVGSAYEIPVSVRIIAATNRDLRTEVDAHRFREDLFFRLNVIQISLPALRDRKEDIPKLIHHFIQVFNRELDKQVIGVDDDVLDILMNYDYRGNIRELENIIEHATTLELSQKISFSSLPAYIKNSISESKPSINAYAIHSIATEDTNVPVSELSPKMTSSQEMLQKVDVSGGVELEGMVEDLERGLIEQALQKANGNKTEAAKLLGISFRSLRYRLKKYGYE